MHAGSTWGSARQLTLAREEAQKALALDPALPEANALMGVMAGNCDYDWKEAERRFRLALAQDPVPTQVRELHAIFYLLPMGQLEEAIEELRRALQQDPLNSVTRYRYAISLAAAGISYESESELRQVLEIDPRFFPPRYTLASGLYVAENSPKRWNRRRLPTQWRLPIRLWRLRGRPCSSSAGSLSAQRTRSRNFERCLVSIRTIYFSSIY